MQGWSDSDAFRDKGRGMLPAHGVRGAQKAAMRLSLSQPPKPKGRIHLGHLRWNGHLDFYLNCKYFKLSCELTYLARILHPFRMPSHMKPCACEQIPVFGDHFMPCFPRHCRSPESHWSHIHLLPLSPPAQDTS